MIMKIYFIGCIFSLVLCIIGGIFFLRQRIKEEGSIKASILDLYFIMQALIMLTATSWGIILIVYIHRQYLRSKKITESKMSNIKN